MQQVGVNTGAQGVYITKGPNPAGKCRIRPLAAQPDEIRLVASRGQLAVRNSLGFSARETPRLGLTDPNNKYKSRNSGEIVAIKVHYLRPRRREVLHKRIL